MGPDWNSSHSNELGRLCQDIGVDPYNPSKQRVKGTNTFHVICYDKIPLERQKGIAFSKVVCTFRPEKSDPNRTRITILGQNIKWPGDVGTKTASLDLLKLLLNIVLSYKESKFATFDIKNFYLQTLLDHQEYVCIKLADTPQDFIKKYNLKDFVDSNSWVYFHIHNGVYGLPQSGALAQALLEKCFMFHDYYQCPLTPVI